MPTYHIEVDSNPSLQDAEFLEAQLYAYNVEQTGYRDGEFLTIWVKNHADEIGEAG